MLIASIILIAIPDSFVGNVTARCVFGVGFGSSYITFIIYASEISSPKIRAQVILTLHLSLTLGMFLFSAFALTTNFAFVMRLKGSLSTALTLFSITLGHFKLKSSHIFLMQNNSKDALDRFQYFQQDSADNPHVESETMQSYIIEEKKRRFDFFGTQNISALLVILLVQLGYLSIFNAFHNFHRAVFLSVYLTVGSTDFSRLAMMGARLVGCMAGFVLLDRVTKRLQFFISAVVISALLLVFAILLQVYRYLYIWTPLLFFLPLEFLLGMGLSPMADILKGELFALKEKPASIAFIMVFTEILHIVTLLLLYTWYLSIGSTPIVPPFIFAATTLACGIGVLLLLHDSRQQSLRLVAGLYSNKR